MAAHINKHIILRSPTAAPQANSIKIKRFPKLLHFSLGVIISQSEVKKIP